MARSFWEKLGQGVGRGLEKARAVGESIGEEAGKRLDAGSARRRLRAAHEKLGEACARVRLDGADEADLLAALGDVPPQLYEAAALDGAGRGRRFWHVTLPMLSPLILFNLVLGLIKSFQAFTQVYLVSEGTGEPVGSTLLLSLHLFLAAFQDLEMGYTSAMAWILFVVLFIATILLFRSSRHWVHYRTSLGG